MGRSHLKQGYLLHDDPKDRSAGPLGNEAGLSTLSTAIVIPASMTMLAAMTHSTGEEVRGIAHGDDGSDVLDLTNEDTGVGE